MQPPRSILLICTRRLGDVLLSTALIRSLRLAWPAAAIDVMVTAGSEVVLQGNPDVRQVYSVGPEGLGMRRMLGLFRRYDLAVPTLPSDRAHLTGFWCGRRRVGNVPHRGWKKKLCTQWVEMEWFTRHTVEQYLKLADSLEVPRHPRVVPPQPADAAAAQARLRELGVSGRYAVLHPVPMYGYKAWTTAGWQALIRALAERGVRTVLSGGPAQEERAQVAAIAAMTDAQPLNLSGQLRFAELTPLLQGAAVFVGPDTSVTHLAAACDTPTIALFGPSTPVVWGPWPQGHADGSASPWALVQPLQHKSNVWIVQGTEACVPCLKEGCEQRPDSRADCLRFMPAARVIAAVDQALR